MNRHAMNERLKEFIKFKVLMPGFNGYGIPVHYLEETANRLNYYCVVKKRGLNRRGLNKGRLNKRKAKCEGRAKQ